MKAKRRLYFLILCFVFCVFTAIFFAVSRSGFLTIEEIEVVGAKRVSQKEVLKRSGLIVGKSGIFFFEDRVIGDILKNHWITSAYVRRELPRKVVIEVKEAEPFCLFVGDRGDLYYMTETGKKLGTANFYEGLDFPVLIGDGIWTSELVGEALDVLKLSLKSNILNWKEISEVNVDRIYGITVFTTDGRRIDFGREDMEEKWYRVEKIITHTREMNLVEKYINVSSGRIGVVSFKS